MRRPLPQASAVGSAPAEGFDLATAIKASQAISSEILVDKVVETLMAAALQHAGAERGLLILLRGQEVRIEAEATTQARAVNVRFRAAPAGSSDLPESLLRFVIRTREAVTVDDASAANPFAADHYVLENRPRSLMCLPLVRQAELVGMLYLENRLASNAFTPARIELLTLLASQAAISLQNARLYTDLRQSEETLRASELRYRTLFESIDEGFCTIEVLFDEDTKPVDYRFLQINPTFERQTGIKNAVGRRMREIAPQHEEHWFQIYGKIALTGEPMRFENEAKQLGRWYDVYAFRVEDPKLGRVGILFNDITERRRLEQQLRLSQRLEAMGALAGGIAHDFNNILGAILGYCEMALRDASRGSRLRRDLDSIMTAGERGRALVDRVLAFSRSGLGERIAVHVEKVAREALDLLEAKLPEGIRVEAQLRAGRAAIFGDPTQVHQVLMNLGTNAVQAMPAGGILSVSLDAVRFEAERAATVGDIAPGECIVLAVADTGTGIAREVIDRIFDPFFTTKEVGTGTGLGLSLVHSIVTGLGGAIDVASAPGAGSEFTVYLLRSGDASESDAGEMLVMPRGAGQRVLIVDDEEPLAGLAARTLEELGYVPTGFTSSAAALAAFRADPEGFDAVITDERMPGMTGSALIEEIRRIRREIPILLMSGYVGGAVASRAREAGANEVMKKPLSARDLATSLARVLRQ